MTRNGLVLGLSLLAGVVGAVATPMALGPAAPLAAPTAAAAAGGLTLTADARYVVEPAKRRVRVAVGLTAVNHRTDTKTRRFYYDRAFLAVQPGTTNFRISSSGARPTVRVQRRTKSYSLLRIDFGKQLAAGATRRFKLTFDIVDPGGAPTRATRIGTSLVSFAAWGLGSEGTPGGSVTAVFPAGFSVEVDAPGLGKPATDPAGNTVFTTGRLANPLAFIAAFVADRPSAYRETTIRVPIGDRIIPVTIRAWPDDPAWGKRVRDVLMRALPALASDIGLPWPVEEPFIVEEAVSRSSSGFSGRYDPPAGKIEIAYYATTFVILHEAAHAWFDGSLLGDRWASEGFASYYALRAARAIGETKVTAPRLTPALAKTRLPLNAWAPPGDGEVGPDEVSYAASLKLAGLIAERASPAGVTAAWRAIHERRAAYQPVGAQAAIETSPGTPDWRGLLDLLEEPAGATFEDLWREWVVRPPETALLGERSAARREYAATIERAGAWRLPRVVRDAMRAWQFKQALELLAGAGRALDDRDGVAAAAAAAGLIPSATMQLAFEGPRGFAVASAEADAQLAAIRAYREAGATRPTTTDALQQIGLWNSAPDQVLAHAAEAFRAGDLRATVEAAAFAQGTWRTAADIGRNRVVAVGGSLAAILLATWLVVRWARDRSVRRRSLAAGEG